MTTRADYWKFAEAEQQFNQTQAGIRGQAATWMLAAFAAIALLLKTQAEVKWLLSPALLIGVIDVMATLGLVVLWINDQLVYQRLLDCGFIIALKMEYDDRRLPPIRNMMMYSAESRGMSRWMTYFYTIPLWAFLAISFSALILRGSLDGQTTAAEKSWAAGVLILFCLGQLCTALWVQKKKGDVGAKARAALFGDAAFAAMFDDSDGSRTQFADVIRRSLRVNE
jgi:hypothetical protein